MQQEKVHGQDTIMAISFLMVFSLSRSCTIILLRANGLCVTTSVTKNTNPNPPGEVISWLSHTLLYIPSAIKRFTDTL